MFGADVVVCAGSRVHFCPLGVTARVVPLGRTSGPWIGRLSLARGATDLLPQEAWAGADHGRRKVQRAGQRVVIVAPAVAPVRVEAAGRG